MGTSHTPNLSSRRDFLRDTVLGAASLVALRLPTQAGVGTATEDPASVAHAVLAASTCKALQFSTTTTPRSQTLSRAFTDIIACAEELRSIDTAREGSSAKAPLSKRQKLETKIHDLIKRCPELRESLPQGSQPTWQEIALSILPQALAPHGILVMAEAKPTVISSAGDDVRQLGINLRFFHTERLSTTSRAVDGVNFTRATSTVTDEYVTDRGALQRKPTGESDRRGGAFAAYGNVFIFPEGLEATRLHYAKERPILQSWLQRVESPSHGLSNELANAEKREMRQFILRQYVYARLLNDNIATLDDPRAFQTQRIEHHEDYHVADTHTGRARGFLTRATNNTPAALREATERSCFHHELSSQIREILDPSGLGLAIVIRNSFAPVDPRSKRQTTDPHDSSADWIVRHAVQTLVTEAPNYGFTPRDDLGLKTEEQALLFLATLLRGDNTKMTKLVDSLRARAATIERVSH